MNVIRIANEWLHSNTYILCIEHEDGVWLVDCGDFDKVDLWLQENHKYLAGILVTHSHHDHIYGIEAALKKFPDIHIYISKNMGREYMRDSKLNMSRYSEKIVSIKSDRFIEVSDNDKFEIWQGQDVTVLETSGHTPDCVSYLLSDHIFTGDAYIPHQKMTSRAKGGNKENLVNSLSKLFDLIKKDNLIVCPGHNEIESASQLKDDLICTIHIH